MLLESLVAGRPSIALTIDDTPLNFFSPKIAYKSYVHFEGIEDLSNFLIIDDLLDFPEAFQNLRARKNQMSTDDKLTYYVDVETPATLTRILGE